jgi:hypothetical protein
MIRHRLASSSIALLLAACSNQQLADKANTATAKDLATATAPDSRQPIRPTKTVYLGKTHVDSDHGDALPERFEVPDGFCWACKTASPPGERLTLAQAAARITRYTGLGVNIDDGSVVSTTPAPGASPAPTSHPSAAATSHDPSIDTINELIRDVPRSDAAQPEPTERLDPYTGPLSGFLNLVATLFGRDWELHGHTIYFPKYLTRHYQIDDFNSEATVSAGLNGLSSSGGVTSSSGTSSGNSTPSGTPSTGGGSSSGQNSSISTNVKPWDEVIKTVQMLAGEKAVTASPASHDIAVRCPRLCQEQVKSYLRDHNRQAQRTIHLVVAIRSLSDTGSDEYGFNPTVAFQKAGFSVALNPQGSQLPTTSTPGSIITSILNPPVGSTASQFSGTSLSLQALSEIDKNTTGITKETIIGNDRVFALRNALDFSFVGQATTNTSSALATATSSLTTLIIGDQLQVLSHLTNDGHIRISLALSQTAQQGNLVTADLGNGATTTFPQVSDNATAPVEFTIRDGQTLILSDVSNRTSDHSTSGSCGVYCWLLGGSDAATNSKTRTLMVVTAEEIHTGDADGSALGRRVE